MRRSLAAVILTLTVATGAAAQDAPRLQRVIDALPQPMTAGQLASLATDTPNAYVYFVQNFLAARGLLKGAADGQLKSSTVSALLAYCRERNIEKVCAAGPLLAQGIGAVSEAIVADLVPVLP